MYEQLFYEHAYDVLEHGYAVLAHFYAVIEQGGVTNQDFIMQNFWSPVICLLQKDFNFYVEHEWNGPWLDFKKLRISF